MSADDKENARLIVAEIILDPFKPLKMAYHPRTLCYRSPEPVLTPDLPQERHGTIANVVFPTGIDRRDDIGKPDRFDVYHCRADNRIRVARLHLTEQLPSGTAADEDR